MRGNMKCSPFLYRNYWFALTIASVIGANLGDYFADVLDLGHENGLPILIGILALICLAEFKTKATYIGFYWGAIVIIRAMATNIGDIFHDISIDFFISIPIVLLVFAAFIATFYNKMRYIDNSSQIGLPINRYYFMTMFLAGVLGTVVGDCFSYRLGFGNLYASLFFLVITGIYFAFVHHQAKNSLIYYWSLIALIRSGGTAFGDYLAHDWFGIGLSTVITGIIFILFVALFTKKEELSLEGFIPHTK